MGKIEIRFSEVMNLSGQLSALAAELKTKECEALQQSLYAAKAVYYGESADLLGKKEVKLNAQLLQEADTLRSLAEELERKARQMYQSESVNQLLAKTRIY